MRHGKNPKIQKAFIDAAFKLYSEKGIEPVSNDTIAEAAGFGIATLYRHFKEKANLAIAVAIEKWQEYDNQKIPGKTAEEMYEHFLDTFIELYRNNKDLLRYNQFFNAYIENQKIDEKALRPYVRIFEHLKEQFHEIYERAKIDGSLNTEESEDEMFSTSFNLMMAAATRYAMGMIYDPEGFDAEKELGKMKMGLMMMYVE